MTAARSVMRRGSRRPRRTLIAAVLVAVGPGAASPQTVSQAPWTGWAQCVVNTQGPGYADQSTHTWTTTGGAPTAAGAFQMHPASWSATGSGSMQRGQGGASLDVKWTTSVPAVSAPISVLVRASDGRRLIRAGHAQLRQAGGITGTRTHTIAGQAPAVSAISAEAFEWAFPSIEGMSTSSRLQGSASGQMAGSFGYMQPAGSTTTAACSWDFAQGSAPSPVPPVATQPSTVAASGPTAGTPSSGAMITASGGGGVGGGSGTVATIASGTGNTSGRPMAPASGAVAAGGGTRPAVAPPSNVMVSGRPMIAHLTWTAAPNAVRYAVWRRDAGTASLERTPASFTGLAFDDTIADPRVTYSYVVTSYDANGRSADAPAVSFVSPAMTNPTGFTATYAGNSSVVLRWQPVAGALRYRVDGPGVPNTGVYFTLPAGTIYSVPSGALGYKLTAVFAGNFADYATASVATVMVRELPTRSTKYLSKNNGAGSPALASAHYAQLCPGVGIDCLAKLEAAARAGGPLTNASANPFWGDPTRIQVLSEAVYGNVADLGFGRRTRCTQVMTAGPEGLVTTCYATSHGAGPGEAGFADSATITRAAAGEVTPPPYVDPVTSKQSIVTHENPWGEMPRSGTVIIKNDQGTSFYAFSVGLWDLSTETPSLAWWPDWVQIPTLQPSVVFDSEGPKAVPHSCMSCHGGRWNATTKRVDGATLLPLDPGTLVFGRTVPGDRTQYERHGQEEPIRRINQIIAQSAPGSAVASYISGLYGGAVGTRGAVARSNYVPQGWAAQSGFYLSVVKPYCASCHLAAPSSVDLASWANFQQNRALIYNAVCVARTMPHSEIAFRQFWTKDTGPVFLPGLLAATLGYPSCP